MKHVVLIILIIVIVLAGIFLPYIHGEYEYFAVGLSYIFQFAIFASSLLVPIGLVWWIMDFSNRSKNNERALPPAYLRKIALIVFVFIVLAAALGALASGSRFSAITLGCSGMYFLFLNRKKVKDLFAQNITPYYFIFIPLTVILLRMTFIEKTKKESTDFAIRQCEQLIQDIESYKNTYGHYPVSLLSTIEDYKPMVSGIPRFYYEPRGNAYNIYFEQISTMLGTQEIVMYNKLDEQEMTVHNQDLLRIPYDNILHGHHKVFQMPGQHWKIFYFD